MQRLLLNPENRGYPADYLLARISGRRARLIRDWNPLIGGTFPVGWSSLTLPGGLSPDEAPDIVWTWLRKEFRWVYFQMDDTLRGIFRPFFLYEELKGLCLCMRYIYKGDRSGKTDNLLALSLLSENLGAVLRSAGDLLSVAAALENLFVSLSPVFGGLAISAVGEGTRGIESELMRRYLTFTAQGKFHPLVKSFFSHVVDARNLMGVYKYLKLDEKTPPSFSAGGSVSWKRYHDIAEKRDGFALMSVIRKLSGVKSERLDDTTVDHSLHVMISRFLRGEGRKPLEIGLILDYLWRCSLQAINLSIIFRGRNLDSKTIEGELTR